MLFTYIKLSISLGITNIVQVLLYKVWINSFFAKLYFPTKQLFKDFPVIFLLKANHYQKKLR